MLILIS